MTHTHLHTHTHTHTQSHTQKYAYTQCWIKSDLEHAHIYMYTQGKNYILRDTCNNVLTVVILPQVLMKYM